MGSSPTLRTRTEPTAYDVSGVQFHAYLRNKRTKKGYLLAETTVKSKLIIINTLQRVVNLWDVEQVQRFIDNSDWTNGRKQNVSYAYKDWCEFKGFFFTPQMYRRKRKIPHVPLERDIDQLIGGFANSKYGAFLQLLKETGFRPIEASRLTPQAFDFI